MDEMRRPLFIAALLCLLAVVGLEVGSTAFVAPVAVSRSEMNRAMAEQGLDGDERAVALAEIAAAGTVDDPPGLAIPMLALVDGMLLLSMLGLASALVIPHAVQGRVVPVVNLVVAFLAIVGGILAIVVALVLVVLMIGLFLAPPFGTIAYLARWGFFPRGAAQTLLSIMLLLRMGFIGCVVASSPRLLKQKGFMALVGTGLVLQLVIGLAHGFAPGPLVSIVDAIVAIIVGIVGVVWAIVILVGSLIGTARLLRGQRT